MSISGDSISGASISGEGSGGATPTAPNNTQNIQQRAAAATYWEMEQILLHRYVFMSPFIPVPPVAPGTLGTTRVDVDRWEAEDALVPLRTRRMRTFVPPFISPQQSVIYVIT